MRYVTVQAWSRSFLTNGWLGFRTPNYTCLIYETWRFHNCIVYRRVFQHRISTHGWLGEVSPVGWEMIQQGIKKIYFLIYTPPTNKIVPTYIRNTSLNSNNSWRSNIEFHASILTGKLHRVNPVIRSYPATWGCNEFFFHTFGSGILWSTQMGNNCSLKLEDVCPDGLLADCWKFSACTRVIKTESFCAYLMSFQRDILGIYILGKCGEQLFFSCWKDGTEDKRRNWALHGGCWNGSLHSSDIYIYNIYIYIYVFWHPPAEKIDAFLCVSEVLRSLEEHMHYVFKIWIWVFQFLLAGPLATLDIFLVNIFKGFLQDVSNIFFTLSWSTGLSDQGMFDHLASQLAVLMEFLEPVRGIQEHR